MLSFNLARKKPTLGDWAAMRRTWHRGLPTDGYTDWLGAHLDSVGVAGSTDIDIIRNKQDRQRNLFEKAGVYIVLLLFSSLATPIY